MHLVCVQIHSSRYLRHLVQKDLTYILKGIVHPKLKLYSSSTHHSADGGVGEVCESTKHFRSLESKLCSCGVIQVSAFKFNSKRGHFKFLGELSL